MKINIQSLHFDADKKLLEFIETKVKKLHARFEDIVSCEVILKLDKSNPAENKVSEIKIHIKGVDIFAKKNSNSFEEATELSLDAIKHQLDKYKEKNSPKKGQSFSND